MAKIVIIGAGSHTFARNLITDILSYPELRDNTITLMDIAQEPLDVIAAFARKLVEQNQFNTKIESTTDRREALDGADYVVTTIQVGGRRQVARDIAAKWGLADGWTGPANGIVNGLRQIPVILDICHDMEKLCPDAWLLQYANPLATITWAVNDYTRIKNVGLCHSVQGTAFQLARYIGAPPEEISYWVAGLNHLAWFLEFKWHGEDAYPLLREKFKDPAVYSKPKDEPDIVRVELFKTFGYFPTEASFINAYFVPYFRKRNRPEVLEQYCLQGPDHPERPPRRDAEFDKIRQAQDEEFKRQISSNFKFPLKHSREFGSMIIHSLETGEPSVIYGNVKNNGLITNLQQGSCVEVPCLVDKEGIHPCHIGYMPPQVAALDQGNISAQELVVRGIVEKDKNKIYMASLLDPLTASILTIDETKQMVDELFAAEKKYVKGYK
jgi:alpha-galactosidase